MSDFTIEQLEALKEGTPEGPWEWYWDQGIISLRGPGGEPIATDINVHDADVLAAPRALVDALIAEKQAHAKLRAEVEAMREDWGRKAERSAGARDNSEHPAKAAHARHLKAHQNVIRRLTRILGATDG